MRRHVAYSWPEVPLPSETPNVLNTEQYGLSDLLPNELGLFDEARWERLEAYLSLSEPGQRAMILRAYSDDTVPHAHPDDSPYYWNNGATEQATLVNTLTTELKRRGLTLDRVFLDFEWSLGRGYLQTLSEDEREAFVADPRYATEIEPLFEQLIDTHTGELLPFTATPDDVLDDPWTLVSYQWNRTMQQRVRAAYRTGLVQPLLDAFPGLQVSNYDDWRAGDDELVPDSNGHVAQRIGFLDGEELAGNRASIQIYGRMNQIESGWKNNPDTQRYPTSYPSGPGNALRWAARKARSAAASGDSVDIWFAPKDWLGHPYPTPLSCEALADDPNAICTDHWEEALLHAVMQTDGSPIFWGPPTRPDQTARTQRVIEVLNDLLACSDRTPLGSLDEGWDAPVLVSGMQVERWRWWRVSSTSDVAPDPDAVVETADGILINWGDTPLIIPGGRLWPESLSQQGRWVVQPITAGLPRWEDRD